MTASGAEPKAAAPNPERTAKRSEAAGPVASSSRAASGPFVALRGLLARPLTSYHLLLASAGLLVGIGLLMVFSATSVEAYQREGNAYADAVHQAIWAVIGLVVFWVCQRLPVRSYRALGYPMLLACLLMLAILVLFPRAGGGIFRTHDLWFYIGGAQIQPSEIAKLALTLWAADVIVRKGALVARWSHLAMPLFPVAGLLLILVGFRDLGTMLCLLLIFLSLLWTAGVRFRIFAGLFGIALLGVLVLIGDQTYRLNRLLAFRDPTAYRDNYGYQAVQSYYALADGGWFGVGLGEGRQKWDWLPNGHNDFIFAVIAEELGVVGCVVVLCLLVTLAYAGLRIATRVTDPFRRLVASACVAWLAGQALINIGGVIGLVPITGLPLPLISDGGSALVVALAAVGVLASFARAEPEAARALHARQPPRWVRAVWAPLPPLPRAESDQREDKPKQARKRVAPRQKHSSKQQGAERRRTDPSTAERQS